MKNIFIDGGGDNYYVGGEASDHFIVGEGNNRLNGGLRSQDLVSDTYEFTGKSGRTQIIETYDPRFDTIKASKEFSAINFSAISELNIPGRKATGVALTLVREGAESTEVLLPGIREEELQMLKNSIKMHAEETNPADLLKPSTTPLNKKDSEPRKGR